MTRPATAASMTAGRWLVVILSIPAAVLSALVLLAILAVSSYPGPSVTGGPSLIWRLALTAVLVVLVATVVAQATQRRRMATVLALVQLVSAAVLLAALLIWIT